MFKMKNMILIIVVLFISGCSDSSNPFSNIEDETSDSYTFIACEGSFLDSNNNGSLYILNESGMIEVLEGLGDGVQAVEVYQDQLYVLINNSQKILIYDISENGIVFVSEILTDGQSPREIVFVDNKAYFTTWDSDYNVYPTIPGFVKVLNLSSGLIEASIEVGIMPEDLLSDGFNMWIANSGESTVSKIDLLNNVVLENYEVGNGPVELAILNDEIYIARTYYDESWNSFFGSSKINNNGSIVINEYGTGLPCGGSVMNYQNAVYRTYSGGIAPLMEDLNVDALNKIGDFEESLLYHAEIINNLIWFGLTDFSDENAVKVLNSIGEEVISFSTSSPPGDFAYWNK